MKIKKSWIIIGVVILLIAGYFISKQLFKDPLANYILEKVSRGEVSQEISETGSVRAAQDINLGFKTTGRIVRINTKEGDIVKKGDILAQLDSTQLLAQLQSAKAGLGSSNLEYQKLLNGLTQEEIKTYQDAVTSAEHDLQSAYEDALNTLEDGYTKIFNAYTTALSIDNSYFSFNDQQGIKVREARGDILKNMQDIRNYIDTAEGISNMLIALDNVGNDLETIRDQADIGIYYSTVSSTDKTSLDTQKGYMNTAISSATTSQQNINYYKIALQKAEDNLSLKTANARREDVSIYGAEIEQAQASVNSLESQLSDNYLRSPIDGRITDVNAKIGEVVSLSEPVVGLLSTEPFQIRVNIYEQDIVNVKINDSVKINLVAFPKKTFDGKVVFINSGEKIVDNVVYYEVTIDFSQQPEGIRSGMTADIIILTNKKENVVRISKNAVVNLDGKDTVQVAVNGKIEDREITTGLEGNDYFEVISGLKENENIVQ